jgi:hypothetical protein
MESSNQTKHHERSCYAPAPVGADRSTKESTLAQLVIPFGSPKLSLRLAEDLTMQRVTDAVTPHVFFLHALFRNRPSCFLSASVLLKFTDALGLHVIT